MIMGEHPRRLDYATPGPGSDFVPRWLDEWFGRFAIVLLVLLLLFTLLTFLEQVGR